MNTTTRLLLVSMAAAFASSAHAQAPADAVATGPIVVKMYIVNADGAAKPIGNITASDSGYGLILKPALTGLPPGLHGFHVHQNPSCAPVAERGAQPEAAVAAGPHYDPAGTGRHEGPYGQGHLGDLPAIYVAPDGKADYPVLAPRLKTNDLRGRSLMIHAGGDNHADHPAPSGGGGARIACGIIEAPKAP